MTRDEVTVAARDLADYTAGLFPPGRGPRADTAAGLEAFEDLLLAFGLPAEEFKRRVLAFALAGGGQWNPADFAASLCDVTDGTVGDVWAKACAWVADGPGSTIYRNGPRRVPSVDEFLADPKRHAMARAVRAIGVEAMRHRTIGDEGTMRAQFRKSYLEARATQLTKSVLGLAPGGRGQALGSAKMKELPRG